MIGNASRTVDLSLDSLREVGESFDSDSNKLIDVKYEEQEAPYGLDIGWYIQEKSGDKRFTAGDASWQITAAVGGIFWGQESVRFIGDARAGRAFVAGKTCTLSLSRISSPLPQSNPTPDVEIVGWAFPSPGIGPGYVRYTSQPVSVGNGNSTDIQIPIRARALTLYANGSLMTTTVRQMSNQTPAVELGQLPGNMVLNWEILGSTQTIRITKPGPFLTYTVLFHIIV